MRKCLFGSWTWCGKTAIVFLSSFWSPWVSVAMTRATYLPLGKQERSCESTGPLHRLWVTAGWSWGWYEKEKRLRRGWRCTATAVCFQAPRQVRIQPGGTNSFLAPELSPISGRYPPPFPFPSLPRCSRKEQSWKQGCTATESQGALISIHAAHKDHSLSSPGNWFLMITLRAI